MEHQRSEWRGELASALSAAESATPSVQEVRNKLATVESRIAEYRARLHQECPAYAELKYPKDISLRDLPLRDDEILIETRTTQEGVFVWLVFSEGKSLRTRFYRVKDEPGDLAANIEKVRAALNSGRPDLLNISLLEQIYRGLFPDSESEHLLAIANNLIFVPDGELALIPWEILSPSASKGLYPIAEKPTKYFSSASAFVETRSGERPSHQWASQLIGFGDPITSESDERFSKTKDFALFADAAQESRPQDSTAPSPANIGDYKSRGLSLERIPATALELREIEALFRTRGQNVELRLGPAATKSDFTMTDLRQFRYVHLATHGLLPAESGAREPALVFSMDGTSDVNRMLLLSSEVLRLQLSAEMVVLSACNTGSGKVLKAEGVSNMGRAFMLAGAQSVTMSLWQVSDDSTATLMKSFYSHILAGDSKSVALKKARTELLHGDFANPFFWGPFILTGE